MTSKKPTQKFVLDPSRFLPKEVTDAMARTAAENYARRHPAPPREPEVGDIMPDGSLYAGVSPDTNRPMYVTAKDAPLKMNFNAAAEYARGLDTHGHKDWRVPTKEELHVLFQNREKGALKGTFNFTDVYVDAWYWSSSSAGETSAWGRHFTADPGYEYAAYKNSPLSVRCIR